MKPKNFPGRKNERRVGALERLIELLEVYEQRTSEKAKRKAEHTRWEIKTLQERVAMVPAKRTKKDRTSRSANKVI